MTIDRDPGLETLFAVAKQELSGEEFTASVMVRIDRARRRTVIGWIGGGIVAAVFAGVAAGPLIDAVNLGMQILPESLIEVDDQALSQIFAPVNSVAGAVGLGFLGIRMVYKAVFS